MKNKYTTLFVIVFVVLLVDQWTKLMAVDYLRRPERSDFYAGCGDTKRSCVARCVHRASSHGNLSLVACKKRCSLEERMCQSRHDHKYDWSVVQWKVRQKEMKQTSMCNSVKFGGSSRPECVVLPNYFHFTYRINRGAAWGIFSDLPQSIRRPFFVCITSIAILFIMFLFIFRLESEHRLMVIALALILGGALGNFLDRIRLDYVIDFIEMFWRDRRNTFPTFNIADTAISIGVGLIAIELFFFAPPDEEEESPEASDASEEVSVVEPVVTPIVDKPGNALPDIFTPHIEIPEPPGLSPSVDELPTEVAPHMDITPSMDDARTIEDVRPPSKDLLPFMEDESEVELEANQFDIGTSEDHDTEFVTLDVIVPDDDSDDELLTPAMVTSESMVSSSILEEIASEVASLQNKSLEEESSEIVTYEFMDPDVVFDGLSAPDDESTQTSEPFDLSSLSSEFDADHISAEMDSEIDLALDSLELFSDNSFFGEEADEPLSNDSLLGEETVEPLSDDSLLGEETVEPLSNDSLFGEEVIEPLSDDFYFGDEPLSEKPPVSSTSNDALPEAAPTSSSKFTSFSSNDAPVTPPTSSSRFSSLSWSSIETKPTDKDDLSSVVIPGVTTPETSTSLDAVNPVTGSQTMDSASKKRPWRRVKPGHESSPSWGASLPAVTDDDLPAATDDDEKDDSSGNNT